MKRPNYVFDDELYHWGIKGQRWGERRFQNEDGSWTPEGRERYGKGDGERVKIEKAKATYNTQKYKADLKSKAQKEKDVRAAKEERNRIRENSKTMLLARKKQGKFDRLNKKEEAKLDNQGRQKIGFGKTKNMSDEDLKNAIERLKLQAEYNKQYALATSPNSALAKADRFFEGPTGKMISQIAINTLPDILKTTTNKMIEKQLEGKKDKYSDPLDKAAKEAEIAKTKANAKFFDAQAQQMLSKLNESSNTSAIKDVIQLPPAYPNAPRSSDIPKTTPVQVSTIGKTVRPEFYNVGKTVAPGYSIIPKTTAPGYSIIPKTTAPEKKKKKR